MAQLNEVNLDSLIKTYLASSSARPDLLFREFLPAGYRSTTLDSVDPEAVNAVVLAKIHLGMIITLYDDLADHPQHRNPNLLSELYKLNLGRDQPTPGRYTGRDREVFELARHLFSQLRSLVEGFPNYSSLEPVLRFDVELFFVANRHAELMSLVPSVRNLSESRTLGPHNMGIVAAGTIDLMASRGFKAEELGQCREVFHLGQRLGRISNLVFTLKREKSEGDLTNEILISQSIFPEIQYQSRLLSEFDDKMDEIRRVRLRTFQSARYAEGLHSLHRLHASLEGRI